MKKILFCFAAALLMLAASCNSDTPSEEQKQQLQQSEVDHATDSLFDEASKVMDEAEAATDSAGSESTAH